MSAPAISQSIQHSDEPRAIPPLLESKNAPAAPSVVGQRFANLDQWRGWALVLVLVNHGFKWTGNVEGLGRVGVNLFFVISGLLTAMSLLSLQRKGKNYILGLIQKRAWRLIPTLLIFVTIYAVVRGFLGLGWAAPEYLKPFYMNYIVPEAGLGHLWSIACEMHFYLLSPFLFWLGTKRRGGAAFLWMLFGVLCVFQGIHILLRAGMLSGVSDTLNHLKFDYKYTTHVAVWPMLLGFLWYLHGLRFPGRIDEFLSAHLTKLVVLAHVGIVVALCLQDSYLTVLVSLFLIPVLLITFQNGRAVDGKPGATLVWIGQRTFSIYLFQQMLTLGLPGPEEWRPLGALLAIPIGALFYELVEKRFIR